MFPPQFGLRRLPAIGSGWLWALLFVLSPLIPWWAHPCGGWILLAIIRVWEILTEFITNNENCHILSVLENGVSVTSLGGFTRELDNFMELRPINGYYPWWLDGSPCLCYVSEYRDIQKMLDIIKKPEAMQKCTGAVTGNKQ